MWKNQKYNNNKVTTKNNEEQKRPESKAKVLSLKNIKNILQFIFQ